MNGMLKEDMDEIIGKWLRLPYGFAFNREVGLYRKVVNEQEFFRYVLECIERRDNCFSSVFALWQIKDNVFDTVFLDIDDGWDDCSFVVSRLRKGDYPLRIYSSGHGYHIYVDFDPIEIENYGAKCRIWAKQLGIFDYVDRKCLGEKRRMARVPLTWNADANKRMEYLTAFSGSKDLSKILNDIDVDSIDKERLNFKFEQVVPSEYPRCMVDLLDKMCREKYLEHEERLCLASYFLHYMDLEDVLNLFRPLKDFDESYTRKQLEWLVDHKYEPYSCQRWMEMGFCNMPCFRYPYMLRDM